MSSSWNHIDILFSSFQKPHYHFFSSQKPYCIFHEILLKVALNTIKSIFFIILFLIIFQPHPVLIKLFTGNYIKHITFEKRELPMLVPPIPWYSSHKGGYILNESKYYLKVVYVFKEMIKNILYPVKSTKNLIEKFFAW